MVLWPESVSSSSRSSTMLRPKSAPTASAVVELARAPAALQSLRAGVPSAHFSGRPQPLSRRCRPRRPEDIRSGSCRGRLELPVLSPRARSCSWAASRSAPEHRRGAAEEDRNSSLRLAAWPNNIGSTTSGSQTTPGFTEINKPPERPRPAGLSRRRAWHVQLTITTIGAVATFLRLLSEVPPDPGDTPPTHRRHSAPDPSPDRGAVPSVTSALFNCA